MKQKKLKTLGLMLVITLGLFTGCNNTSAPSSTDAPALTAEKASEANTVANLLKKYKTVTYAQLDYIGGNTVHMTYFKDEKGNYCATEDDSGYTGYRTDGFAFSREKGESTYDLIATKDNSVSDYLFMVSDSEFTSKTTDKSGNLVCETQADIDEEYAKQLSEVWSATTKDKMITKTVFAPDDFRVLSVDFSIRRPDNSESKIAYGVMLYDKEVQYTDAVQNYLNSEKCTMSVQMPDGSSRTALIPKGEKFSWDCDDGFALYADVAGKTPLIKESTLAEQDMTMYVLKAKS